MARLGADAGVEVSLFLGPRGAWDTGGQSLVDGRCRRSRPRRGRDRGVRSPRCDAVSRSASARSSSPTSACCRRSARCERAGELPASLVLKTSVLLPCANPATAAALEELGATTINVSTDLSAAELGELRAACAAPLDVYVEVPDDQGGFVRFYDVPDIVRARGARLREARAPQRAEHLPVRPAPRGARGEARPRARASRRARPAPARGARARARRGPRRRRARPTSGSPSREGALRRDLHGRARGHPRRPRAPRPDAAAVDPAARAGNATGRARRTRSRAARRRIRRRRVRQRDPQGARDARRRPGGARRRVRLRPRRVGASRRAVGDVAARRAVSPAASSTAAAATSRFILDEGFPVFCPLRHARGLDVALGARGDAGSGHDRRACASSRETGSSATTTAWWSSRRRSPRTCSRRRRRRPRRRARSAPPSATGCRRSRRTSATGRSELLASAGGGSDSRRATSRCRRCP